MLETFLNEVESLQPPTLLKRESGILNKSHIHICNLNMVSTVELTQLLQNYSGKITAIQP